MFSHWMKSSLELFSLCHHVVTFFKFSIFSPLIPNFWLCLKKLQFPRMLCSFISPCIVIRCLDHIFFVTLMNFVQNINFIFLSFWRSVNQSECLHHIFFYFFRDFIELCPKSKFYFSFHSKVSKPMNGKPSTASLGFLSMEHLNI